MTKSNGSVESFYFLADVFFRTTVDNLLIISSEKKRDLIFNAFLF